MEHRSRGRLAVLWAFMTLTSACGGNPGGQAADPDEAPGALVAVDEASLRPPGTELAPGVEVQTGSSLVGTSMPIVDVYQESGSGSESLGWQAVLVVEGNPIEVWDRYVAHLGVDDAQAYAVGSCVVQAEEQLKEGELFTPPPERSVTEPPVEGENRIACHANVAGVTMALVMGTMPCLDYKIDDPPCPLHSASHLYIGVRHQVDDRLEADGTRAIEPTPGTEPPETMESVPQPEDALDMAALLDDEAVSRLPEEGERFDDGLDYYLDGSDVALVPEGGRSLVAPAILLDCNSGLVALLEVPGTPADVVGIFDEADDQDDDLISVEGTDAQGRSWAGGTITTAGGYYLDLVALDTGGGTSTVLLDECGD